jgi:DoxX-like family
MGSCFSEVGFIRRVLNQTLILFSVVSFVGYGATCIWTAHMRQEFERYRLERQRVLVGSLQLLAALGLLAGLSQPWLGRAAAGGLALMMLVGVVVRYRIKDSPPQMAPAFFYMVLNAYLSVAAF